MFPYHIIIASQLLKQGKKEPNTPSIDSLHNYIQMPTVEFYNLLCKRLESAGLLETAEIISKWQNFDFLSEKQKVRFTKETVDPNYYSLFPCIKRIFKKLKLC